NPPPARPGRRNNRNSYRSNPTQGTRGPVWTRCGGEPVMGSQFDSSPTGGERVEAQRLVQSLAKHWSGIGDRELRTFLVRSDVLTDLQTVVESLGAGCDPHQARQIARAKALVAELDEWNRRP